MDNQLFWEFIAHSHIFPITWGEWSDLIAGHPGLEGFASNYLCLSENISSYVICRANCVIECPREVQHCSDDEIMAVCTRMGYPPYITSKTDTLMYSLNSHGFHCDVCSALGIEFREHTIEKIQNLFLIGYFHESRTETVPVYLMYRIKEQNLLQIMKIMYGSGTPERIILLMPAKYESTADLENIIDTSKSKFILLSDELRLSSSGIFKAIRPLSEIVQPGKEVQLQTKKKNNTHSIVSDQSEWETITIVLIDGHRLSVRLGIENRVCDYVTMGMSSTKNCQPNKQWNLLLKFAESEGTIKLKRNQLSADLKKQKHRLSLVLKDFFGIESEPIEWVKNRNLYRCRFKIFTEK